MLILLLLTLVKVNDAWRPPFSFHYPLAVAMILYTTHC